MNPNQPNDLYARLLQMADPGYRRFASSLLPGVTDLLGVRLPKLREIAKEIASGTWQEYLTQTRQSCFEEKMVYGMVIGLIPCSKEERLRWIENFVPQIDNWSVCDSFCFGLRPSQAEKMLLWERLPSYFSSDKEYGVRFAAVLSLRHYADSVFVEQALERLLSVRHTGYYARMGTAWAWSTFLIEFPDQTKGQLLRITDPYVLRTALRKTLESKRPDPTLRNWVIEQQAILANRPIPKDASTGPYSIK